MHCEHNLDKVILWQVVLQVSDMLTCIYIKSYSEDILYQQYHHTPPLFLRSQAVWLLCSSPLLPPNIKGTQILLCEWPTSEMGSYYWVFVGEKD